MFFNNEFASRYDGLVKKQNWYGSEVLFGMIFEYIQMKEYFLGQTDDFFLILQGKPRM